MAGSVVGEEEAGLHPIKSRDGRRKKEAFHLKSLKSEIDSESPSSSFG
jgi:hypothetical protein